MKHAKFKKLDVWKDSIELTKCIYPVIQELRSSRDYVLSDQLWRSSVSISSNIAEGSCSGSDSNFVRNINMAYASLNELRSQIALCEVLNFHTADDLHTLDEKADSLEIRLLKLKKYLQSESS